MSDAIFKNRKVISEKLISFGFIEGDGRYVYATDIVSGQFQMMVTVLDDGTVSTKVVDSSSNEEYVLHRTSGACVWWNSDSESKHNAAFKMNKST